MAVIPIYLETCLHYNGKSISLSLANTFSIEISTGSEINEDLHDGNGISLGTPLVALKGEGTIETN